MLIGICLLLVLVGRASDTNGLTRRDNNFALRPGARQSEYPLFIGRNDEKAPVWIMERLESETLCELLPRHTIYRLISSRDPIHYANVSALLLDTNGVPTHLESDKDVADFLGSLTLRRDVGSTTNALKFVRAFAALRSYKIAESPPDFKDARDLITQPASLPSDFKFFAEDRKGEWRAYATLMTSDYGGSYERYVFTMYKKPGMGFHFAKPVVIRLRNSVY